MRQADAVRKAAGEEAGGVASAIRRSMPSTELRTMGSEHSPKLRDP